MTLLDMADEADRSVILALLLFAFLGKCDDQGLGPRGWSFSCLVIPLHRLSEMETTASRTNIRENGYGDHATC